MQDVLAEWEEEGDPDYMQLLQCAPVPVWLLCAVALTLVSTCLLPHIFITDGYLFCICLNVHTHT